MNIIKQISKDFVIQSFLAAELNSSRFSEGSEKALTMLHLPKSLITKPDLSDLAQNHQRAKILNLTRGWPNQWLFSNFPSNTKWYLVELTLDELKNSYRLKSRVGMNLSERNIGNTSSNISNNREVKNINKDLVFQIRKKIEADEYIPPIILVSKNNSSRKVLVEGHSRSIAYSLSNQSKVKAILGLSSNITNWKYF